MTSAADERTAEVLRGARDITTKPYERRPRSDGLDWTELGLPAITRRCAIDEDPA